MDGSKRKIQLQARSLQTTRPRTQKDFTLRRLSFINDTQDYIMITQEILDSFKEKSVTFHKLDLKLNPERQQSSQRFFSCRRNLSQTTLKRSQWFDTKSYSSSELNGHIRHRPVKIFVDDYTKGSIGHETTLGDTHDFPGHLKSTDNNFTVVKTPKQRSELAIKRDTGSDVVEEISDDIIEKVARANAIHVARTPVLPEIRAAPCPIHVKQYKGKLCNVSEENVDFVNQNLQQKTRNSPNKDATEKQKRINHVNVARNRRLDISVKIPEQFESLAAPAFPKHMSSKDYVMTWLVHGSAPNGENHFPGIISYPVKTKAKSYNSFNNIK